MENNSNPGFIVPGYPQPLLAPEKNQGWNNLREAFNKLKIQIENNKIDLLLLYSTGWPSIIGHQIQADPNPEWIHVDQEFHELGEIHYNFKIDPIFAENLKKLSQKRGLYARTVSYNGFPIDTGSVTALKLLNPHNKIPAVIVSCNMYADRAETIVFGKACADAISASGKKVGVVAVTGHSNRMFTEDIDPKDDAISSLKDDEWNRKILELLSQGRLEDVSQLSRQISREANGDSKFKAFWWLAAVLGQSNQFAGEVLSYEAIMGTGAAVVSLFPDQAAAQDQEFDEDDVEIYGGDRKVLGGDSQSSSINEIAENSNDE